MSDCGNVKKVFVPSEKEVPTSQKNKHSIMGIEIDPIAVEKIKVFLNNAKHNPKTHGLSIKLVKDGCSGQSYVMDLKALSAAKKDQDKIIKQDGAHVFIEKTSYFLVTGSTLSYTEALTGSGFQLINPNAKRFCACGSSFAT